MRSPSVLPSSSKTSGGLNSKDTARIIASMEKISKEIGDKLPANLPDYMIETPEAWDSNGWPKDREILGDGEKILV